MLYCEGAWAGEYTRLCIAKGCSDFGSSTTNDPSKVQPDPALDPFFVLTYYLFYPCTEPPPGSTPTAGAPITNKREGQWEAVSFYFNAAPAGEGNIAPAILTLPSDPAGVTPAYVVMSQGVLASGDGTDTAGLSANYPAQANTQTSPPSPTTGGFRPAVVCPLTSPAAPTRTYSASPRSRPLRIRTRGLVAGGVTVGAGGGRPGRASGL